MSIFKIANLAFCLALAVNVSTFNPIPQSDDPTPKQILAAIDSGVETEPQFQIVAGFIKASNEEEKWRKIPWIPSLWEGMQIANEKNQPLFIWAMNGDPLGCV